MLDNLSFFSPPIFSSLFSRFAQFISRFRLEKERRVQPCVHKRVQHACHGYNFISLGNLIRQIYRADPFFPACINFERALISRPFLTIDPRRGLGNCFASFSPFASAISSTVSTSWKFSSSSSSSLPFLLFNFNFNFDWNMMINLQKFRGNSRFLEYSSCIRAKLFPISIYFYLLILISIISTNFVQILFFSCIRLYESESISSIF